MDLRLLKKKPAHLNGELVTGEWAPDFKDELIAFASPLHYDLEVELQQDHVFVHGPLEVRLQCTCGRCLKNFVQTLEVNDFAAFVPLEGEESLTRSGDIGDLTPLLREDIYLALPANPVCNPECRGLARKAKARDSRLEGERSDAPSPWTALDRLKL